MGEEHPFKAGVTIGRYKILEEVGQGAMAIVFKAFDPQINRTLAIKVLRQDVAADKEYRDRFLREAKAAGKLSHPNIVTVFDVGEAEGYPYIAMELLEGETLDQVMRSGKRLSVKEVLDSAVQLADALDYSHSQGVVHRDIKPSNVVVRNDHKTLCITDFGIAHMDTTDATERTRMGAVLGTPNYMSPEQARGQRIDGRSDLFSLGVMLYQMLTGEQPFRSDSLAAVLLQIVGKDPDPVTKCAPDVPPGLCRIVEKLLKKAPKDRYQKGRDLAVALRQVQQAVQEEERKRGEKRIIPIRIRWSLIMAGLVAVTLLVGLTLVYERQYQSMVRLVVDYGSALARFVASESADDLLVEDWVAVETLVQEAGSRPVMSYLSISDRNGVIRASTETERVGEPYRPPQERTELGNFDGIDVYDVAWAGGRLFYFDTPILFRDKEVGRLHLGISQQSLQNVGRVAMVMMLVLMLVTVIAVVTVAFWLAKRLEGPVKTLKQAMFGIEQGQLEQRILERRNDEFGQLYDAFNRMAEGLQAAAEDEDEHTVPAQHPLIGTGSGSFPGGLVGAAGGSEAHGQSAAASSRGDSSLGGTDRGRE